MFSFFNLINKLVLLGFILSTSLFTVNTMALPKDFVYLKAIDSSIIQEIKYFTDDNFMGRPAVGYESSECILTREAAMALSRIQQQLQHQSLGLKVYDCYRPQSAVDVFIAWSKDTNDQKMKHAYYPNIDKRDFFKLGYAAKKSSHTRGSTVDLTIISLAHKKTHDMLMGTHFDFMDERSHTISNDISREAQQNRLFLRKIMDQGGFVPIDEEWWHFTLKNEPFPNTYFNFPVK